MEIKNLNLYSKFAAFMDHSPFEGGWGDVTISKQNFTKSKTLHNKLLESKIKCNEKTFPCPLQRGNNPKLLLISINLINLKLSINN